MLLVISIKMNMQLTNFNIMDNRIKSAKNKLNQHRVRGAKSNLSIFEVARLMDAIRTAEEISNVDNNSIFFSLN